MSNGYFQCSLLFGNSWSSSCQDKRSTWVKSTTITSFNGIGPTSRPVNPILYLTNFIYWRWVMQKNTVQIIYCTHENKFVSHIIQLQVSFYNNKKSPHHGVVQQDFISCFTIFAQDTKYPFPEQLEKYLRKNNIHFLQRRKPMMLALLYYNAIYCR